MLSLSLTSHRAPTVDPTRPTTATPGSPAKIALLTARLALRLPLHVQGDAQHETQPEAVLARTVRDHSRHA